MNLLCIYFSLYPVLQIYACFIPYYSFIAYSFNLSSFLIRSKINHLIDCCLSLYFLRIIYFAVRLLEHGDIELIHGLKYFSNFHWNLNSLTAHNYLQVFQLQTYNLVHKFDIICISKTHLDSWISKDGNVLPIGGYSIIREDHPLIPKKGVHAFITVRKFL